MENRFDDCSEKPVHLRCGREGKAVKNPGMFRCITPGINLALGADSLCEHAAASQFEISSLGFGIKQRIGPVA